VRCLFGRNISNRTDLEYHALRVALECSRHGGRGNETFQRTLV
jgi:hypothetical protein